MPVTLPGTGEAVETETAAGGERQVIKVGESALPSGAATDAKQDTGNTSLGSIDTKLTSQATAAKQDTAQTALDAIQASLAGTLDVDTGLNLSGLATSAKQDSAKTVLDAIAALVGDAATEATLAAISAQLPSVLSSDRLKVELDAAALSALETIQVGSIAAGDNNIGNVDVVTLPALPAGSNNIGTVELSATALAALETINAVSSGDVASGASDTGNPLSVGLRAATTNPTAVTDGQRVKGMGDPKGRFVTVGLVPRGLSGRQGTTVSNTTNETTIVTAVASTYLDLKKLVLTNGGNVATRVDVRDDTGGSVQFSVWLAANGGGVVLTFEQPLEQSAQNKNWTVQCSAAVMDLRVLAQFVKNT